jgi:hypothetical protein
MPRIALATTACWLGALLLAQGCAHEPVERVEVPPRVVLASWPTIGIVEFSGAAEPELATLATSQFLQMLHAAQPGAPIVELGSERRVLDEVHRGELDFEAARAIGKRYGVDAIFVGELVFDSPRGSVNLGQAFESIDASANVTGRLATRLLEARSGATVWSDSSSATAPVARFGLAQGVGPMFGVSDPHDARIDMVRQLVANQRYDFYSTWRNK